MKLFQFQKIMEVVKQNPSDDELYSSIKLIFNKKDITQQQVLDLIEDVKSERVYKVGKYILIGRKIFKITTDILMDSASDYASYEHMLLTYKENPYPIYHKLISVYLKPLFGKKNLEKTSNYIQKHLTLKKSKSLYFFLSKKEQKDFYNIRTYLLKQSRMTS